MDENKKRLLLLAGIGLVVLYLFNRAKSASPTATAAAADPLQGVAQQLAAQAAQQQGQLAYGAAALQQQEANTMSQFDFFKKLAADPAYACPNGGVPKWIPGQGPGCIAHKSSGITLGSLISGALSGASSYFSGGAAAAGRVGTTGINGPVGAATRTSFF